MGGIALLGRLAYALAAAGLLLPAPARAQVPRLSPPPPCRLPAGFRDPLIEARLGGGRLPKLIVLPLTQGVVERRYGHVPWVLAERVREALRERSGVVVASSGTTARLAFEAGGSADSARTLANADWILAGAVEPVGPDTRVSARLTRGAAGTTAWEGSFLLSRYSMSRIERTIVDAVVDGLDLPPSSPRRLVLRPRDDVDHAYAAAGELLRGHGAGAADSAEAQFEAVFRSDTGTAVATALALAMARSLERAGPADTNAALPRLRRIDALLDYSARGDPDRADILTIRGIVGRYRDPVSLLTAEASHRRAASLDPASAEAAHELAVTLAQLGAERDANAAFRRALSLDPGRPASLAALADLEEHSGSAALACGLTNAAIAADPFDPRAYGVRARARLQLMQAREAYADAETALQIRQSPWTRAIHLEVEAAASNVDRARALARGYVRQYLGPRSTLRVDDALAVSRALDAAGFPREAIAALERARPKGRALEAGMRDQRFNRLRSDPAFDAVMRSIPRRQSPASRGRDRESSPSR